MGNRNIDYQEVTETADSYVSNEQIERMYKRYQWAAEIAKNKDVIEVGCGTGQGLNLLLTTSKTVQACDISKEMIKKAKENYLDEDISFSVSKENLLPYSDNTADCIIFFEAIYYIENISELINEIKRVLRKGGKLLISTANPDLYDFNKSPYSFHYYGAESMNSLFVEKGFDVELFGDVSLKKISLKQKIFRFAKYIAVKFDLIPKTMVGKKIFKKIVFGKLVIMPKKIIFSDDKSSINFKNIEPVKNLDYKVILAECKLI